LDDEIKIYRKAGPSQPIEITSQPGFKHRRNKPKNAFSYRTKAARRIPSQPASRPGVLIFQTFRKCRVLARFLHLDLYVAGITDLQ
jgi:hypothetical protein